MIHQQKQNKILIKKVMQKRKNIACTQALGISNDNAHTLKLVGYAHNKIQKLLLKVHVAILFYRIPV